MGIIWGFEYAGASINEIRKFNSLYSFGYCCHSCVFRCILFIIECENENFKP